MIIALILITTIIILAIYNIKGTSKKIAALKRHYEVSLQGGDRRFALDAGRAYYSALRKGKTLTIYDEQAITNDNELSSLRIIRNPTS